MLTLNEFAAILAEYTGCSNQDAESFLRELFSLTAERLESEGTVEVPSLGTFSVIDDKVVFQPDKELADAVNMPFADFKPVEVPENFSVVELSEEHADTQEPVMEETTDSESIEYEEPQPPEYTAPQETMPDNDASEPSDKPSVEPEPQAEPDAVSPKPASKIGCCWASVIGLICLGIGFIVGWLISQHYAPVEGPVNGGAEIIEEVNDTEPGILADIFDVGTDSIAESIGSQAYPQVLDTVRAGNFLTTMARKHYKQMEYWVYIYEANAQKLGNPDFLEAGTVVVIPPADSLGLVPGSEAKIAEASRKSAEILDRFN